eukprot:scaffold18014_cov95-Isochrysis_galbana.AAC.2
MYLKKCTADSRNFNFRELACHAYARGNRRARPRPQQTSARPRRIRNGHNGDYSPKAQDPRLTPPPHYLAPAPLAATAALGSGSVAQPHPRSAPQIPSLPLSLPLGVPPPPPPITHNVRSGHTRNWSRRAVLRCSRVQSGTRASSNPPRARACVPSAAAVVPRGGAAPRVGPAAVIPAAVARVAAAAVVAAALARVGAAIVSTAVARVAAAAVVAPTVVEAAALVVLAHLLVDQVSDEPLGVLSVGRDVAENEELLRLAPATLDETEGARLLLHHAERGAAVAGHVADGLARHLHHCHVVAVAQVVDVDGAVTLLEQPLEVGTGALALLDGAADEGHLEGAEGMRIGGGGERGSGCPRPSPNEDWEGSGGMRLAVDCPTYSMMQGGEEALGVCIGGEGCHLPDILHDASGGARQLAPGGAVLAQRVRQLRFIHREGVGREALRLGGVLLDVAREVARPLRLDGRHHLELGAPAAAARAEDGELLRSVELLPGRLAVAVARAHVGAHKEHEGAPLLLDLAERGAARARDVTNAVTRNVDAGAIVALLPTGDEDGALELLEQPAQVLLGALALLARARHEDGVAD